jgi:hypothetical protein
VGDGDPGMRTTDDARSHDGDAELRAHAVLDSGSSNLITDLLGADTGRLRNMTIGAIADFDPVVGFVVVVSAITWS